MKVKEILEILLASGENVNEKHLLGLLDNIGVVATLDTTIDPIVIKKLGKRFKTEIKPLKPKKEPVEKPVVAVAPAVKQEPVAEKKPEPIVKEESKPAVVEAPKEVKPAPKAEVAAPKKEFRPQPGKPGSTGAKPAGKSFVKTEGKSETSEIAKPAEAGKEVELNHVYDDKYNDFETESKVYTRIKNIKKSKTTNRGSRQTNITGNDRAKANVLVYSPGMTVAQMADGLAVPVGEIVRKLVMLGYMMSANASLEKDVIEIIADEYHFTLKDKILEDITKFEDIKIEDDESLLKPRPAIVTIMGHVDHGKTTLLDTIRHSKVVASEAGGITQHIGAYQVKKNGKLITFIDTPGHAAFTEMRARGANATDIVILVVAADDGVMPQTKEAIDHAQAAKVPIIVAINKMDKPSANPDRVKQELSGYNLVAEEWGGKTIFVPISALTGKGVEELLEMVLLTADLENYRANPDRLGFGLVIEAKLDKGRGPVATLLVKNGTVKIGDPIVVGTTYGKIRAMQDEIKSTLKSAGPSKPVEITGLVDVPLAGDHFMIFEDEKVAKLVAEERALRTYNKEMGVGKPISLANIFDDADNTNKELNLIVKADVQGSVEALKGSLEKVTVAGVNVNVVRASVGAVTETDISLAIASKSVIIAFNIRPAAKITEYAKEKNIEIRLYNIIYKVLEDIEAAMKGMLEPVFEEKVTGQAEVRSIFKASKIGTIAGCYVTSGSMIRSSEIRLIRDSIVIYTGKMSSLKRFKDDVKEVKTGFECGITIENYNDIKEGDLIESFAMEEVK